MIGLLRVSMPTTSPDALEEFASELLRAAGFSDLPTDARERCLRSIREQAQHRIGAIAVQQLDDAGLIAFQALTTSTTPPAPEALHTFFATRVADFETKLREGLLQFADEFLAGAKRAVTSA